MIPRIAIMMKIMVMIIFIVTVFRAGWYDNDNDNDDDKDIINFFYKKKECCKEITTTLNDNNSFLFSSFCQIWYDRNSSGQMFCANLVKHLLNHHNNFRVSICFLVFLRKKELLNSNKVINKHTSAAAAVDKTSPKRNWSGRMQPPPTADTLLLASDQKGRQIVPFLAFGKVSLHSNLLCLSCLCTHNTCYRDLVINVNKSIWNWWWDVMFSNFLPKKSFFLH